MKKLIERLHELNGLSDHVIKGDELLVHQNSTGIISVFPNEKDYVTHFDSVVKNNPEEWRYATEQEMTKYISDLEKELAVDEVVDKYADYKVADLKEELTNRKIDFDKEDKAGLRSLLEVDDNK